MSLTWLTPAAWLGLTLVALPIVIHLLARHRRRRVMFPSLRFVPASRLASLRRTQISEWPLLLVRVAIIAAAVAAAAAPVFVSSSRRQAWNERVARAIVVTSEQPAVATLAADEARQSFVSARFAQAELPDALKSAAQWLQAQPPAAREVVIIGDVRERAVTARDLDVLGGHVGIRFLPVASDADQNTSLVAVADVDGRVEQRRVDVQPETTRTVARYVAHPLTATDSVWIMAAQDQQAYADALLRAVFRDGVLVDTTLARRLAIAFRGAAATEALTAPVAAWMREVLAEFPEVRGAERDGALYVDARMAVTDGRAPELVAAIVRRTFAPDLDRLEPRRVSPAVLAQWSRASSGVPDNVRPGDEGDRRWFWALALVLIAAEHRLRRRRRA